jgi:hypothetical protein
MSLGRMSLGRLIRVALGGLTWAWVAGPPVMLVIAVLAGRLTPAGAVDLVIWLVLPWLAVLGALVVAAAVLGPYRPRPARSPGGRNR